MDGVFIYHPLGPQMPLYAVYATGAAARNGHPDPLPTKDRERLWARYLAHMRRLDGSDGRGIPTGQVAEDARPLLGRFRAFFPHLLSRSGLNDRVLRDVGIYFPDLPTSDSRCLQLGESPCAVFVTSRCLDLVELFARTLALCVQLNILELAHLLGAETPPPPHLLLAWMNMYQPALPDIFRFDDLLAAAGNSTSAVEDEVFSADGAGAISEEYQRGWSHYRLTRCLTWMVLRAIKHLENAPSELQHRYSRIVEEPEPSLADTQGAGSLDSGYFATLILSFIVLHEIGHLYLRHNRLDGGPVEPSLEEIVGYVTQHAAGGENTKVQNLIGTAIGHETAADNFALEVITDDDARDVLLEASTLWLAALVGTHNQHGDWLANVQNDMGKHPNYAMRVWYLNGRFSMRARQGRIAQEITKQVEALSQWSAPPAEAASSALPDMFARLWSVAVNEVRRTAGVRRR